MKKHDITDAQDEMLLALCKKWRMKPSEVLGEWCEENYFQVFRKKK